MPSHFSELTDELKGILSEDMTLNRNIERYKELFPKRVEMYQQKFGIDLNETVNGLYIADYLLTSTDIPNLDEEERLDTIFTTLLQGRDHANINFSNQLKLINMTKKLVSHMNKWFKYQSDRGIPLQIIKTQIIETFFCNYFEECKSQFPNIDFRWILTQIEFIFLKNLDNLTFLSICNLIDTPSNESKNYYFSGWIMLDRFSLSIKNEERISKTSFQTQIHGTQVLLTFFDDKLLFLGNSNFSLNNDIANPVTKEIILELQRKLPKFQGDKESNEAVLYQVLLKQKDRTMKRLILITEKENNKRLVVFILSNKLEDVNFTHIRYQLKRYLSYIIPITSRSNSDIKLVLEEWANLILIQQTVIDAEINGLIKDVEREKIWTIHSLINSTSMSEVDNVSIYSQTKYQTGMVNNLAELIQFNGIIHKLIEFFDTSLKEFIIIPYETYFNSDDNSSYYILFHHKENRLAAITLKSYESTGKYIEKKSELNRKFTRMKIPELVNVKNLNYKEWLLNKFGFENRSHIFEVEKHSIMLKEPYANDLSENEKQEDLQVISVSNRLKELEKTKDIQIEVQKQIFDFLLDIITSYVHLHLFQSSKSKNFVKDRKITLINNIKENIEKQIDQFSIYKLPYPANQMVMDIAKTFDSLVDRDIREAMFKLENLERELSKLSNTELQNIFQLLGQNRDKQ